MAFYDLMISKEFETRITIWIDETRSEFKPISEYDMYDDCANCDGGNCDVCCPVYSVKAGIRLPEILTGSRPGFGTFESRYFENADEAQEYYDELVRKWIAAHKKGSC